MAEPRGCGGFTYLGLMILIAIMGITLAFVGQVWHTQRVRENERELLFIGVQYARAIGGYQARHGGPPPERFPKGLEDLLDDEQQIPPQRYLRKLYRDPFTDKPDWGLVRNDAGRIVGVYSLADGTPVKRIGFPPGFDAFIGAVRYADWKFTVALPVQAAVAPSAAPGTVPPPATGSAPTPVTQPTVVQPPPKLVERPPRNCARINASDIAICESQRTRWGEATVSDCLASAQARATACGTGEDSLPFLYIRYQ